MSLPEFAVQIMIVVVSIRAMEMSKIAPKEAGHEHHTGKWRQRRGALCAQDF